ncbi:MAG: ribonuclease activity regulator RraA [Alphaproteobacteria bacterium]|nr:ribonuclease activity regulator RraA [Alphaproteobacteria bacterium]
MPPAEPSTPPDLPDALRRRLLAVAVPTLSQLLYGRGLRTRFLAGLMPLNPAAARFCGPAFTMRAIPVREDLREATEKGQLPNLHRRGLDAVPPGAVLVCATGGAAGVSVLGDIIAAALHRRGVAGVVVDTGIADAALVARMALPVVAAGSAPVPSPAQVMVVDTGLPIGIAGVAVYPGDIMVGDANGVVCVPHGIAETVAAAAAEKEALETWILDEIARGAPLDGTYPPNAEALARYRAWRERGPRG